MRKDIVLNGVRRTAEEFRSVSRSLSDKHILAVKGGFLFKAALIEENLHIGILPWILDGARTHHYDIHLETENMYTLIGSIDLQGVWSLLFVPEKGRELSSQDKTKLRRVYAKLAAVVTESGASDDTPLDAVTGQMIIRAGICAEIPVSLGSLKKM